MTAWMLVIFLSIIHAQESNKLELASNPHAQCGTETTEDREWSYCIYRYENHSQKVVYYFHGLTGDKRDWERNSEKPMLARWKATGQQPPLIVSLSFGRSWFLAEKNSSQKSGLFELFSQKIQPYIQSQLLGLLAEQNILLGFSMGGFNASQLYVKTPHLYSRAALICPAMATISPYASQQEIRDYILRTSAQAWRVLLALKLSRSYFPTEQDWQKHSPVTLASFNLTPLSAPLYISNGLNDEFGFQEGNQAFADLAIKSGTSVKFDFYENSGHCEVDQTPIADFLVADETGVSWSLINNENM